MLEKIWKYKGFRVQLFRSYLLRSPVILTMPTSLFKRRACFSSGASGELRLNRADGCTSAGITQFRPLPGHIRGLLICVILRTTYCTYISLYHTHADMTAAIIPALDVSTESRAGPITWLDYGRVIALGARQASETDPAHGGVPGIYNNRPGANANRVKSLLLCSVRALHM